MSVKPYQLRNLADDPYLAPYMDRIRHRQERAFLMERRLTGDTMSLADFASAHEYFGLHRTEGGWTFREWAPNATSIYLIGTFSDWRESDEYQLDRIDDRGTWEVHLPPAAMKHGDLYRIRIHWHGGSGDRIPAYTRRAVQDNNTKIFSAQVWTPPNPYVWKHQPEDVGAQFEAPLIYEAHVGMAQEKEAVGTYDEFRTSTLPRIVDSGYNTLQLMAVMEHPYYGSFGYHVSNFFAASSRFGTPDELKRLVDEAHIAGLTVIMDLIHSHAVKNEIEGLSRFDGTLYQYFHEGDRGNHVAWDSRCFDYGKPEVLHFLLSNCRFWLDEYRMDGFRFDGVTSMLYHHHGLGPAFDHYDRYFDSAVDEDAFTYLCLANKVIHSVKKSAITIAEDVSGMPGLTWPISKGGCGFTYRLAMGVPDCWFKLIRDTRDDDWSMNYLWNELTNRRMDERTISYTECHDQAIVGGKTVIFHLIDKDMYTQMSVSSQSLLVDRGIALHKMIKLATIATAADGGLNFMGNEFGHPEWVDFPREGNNWSYKYARRQWRLRDDPNLRYHFLADFDKEMIGIIKSHSVLGTCLAQRLWVHDADKVLTFERGGLFFFFNFHPSQSWTDYSIELPPGEYELLLDTDEGRFGGQNRIAHGQHYRTEPAVDQNIMRHCIRVYLPARTAMVIKRIQAAVPGESEGAKSAPKGTAKRSSRSSSKTRQK